MKKLVFAAIAGLGFLLAAAPGEVQAKLDKKTVRRYEALLGDPDMEQRRGCIRELSLSDCAEAAKLLMQAITVYGAECRKYGGAYESGKMKLLKKAGFSALLNSTLLADVSENCKLYGERRLLWLDVWSAADKFNSPEALDEFTGAVSSKISDDARILALYTVGRARYSPAVVELVSLLKKGGAPKPYSSILALAAANTASAEAVKRLIEEFEPKKLKGDGGYYNAIALGLARERSACGPLIEGLESKDARARAGCARALTMITGMDFQESKDEWDRWHAENGDSFEPATPGNSEFERLAREAAGYVPPVARTGPPESAATFFGLKVMKNSVFLIGADKLGEVFDPLAVQNAAMSRGGNPRHYRQRIGMSIVKEEVGYMFEELTEIANINFVFFAGQASVYSRSMLPADKRNKAAILKNFTPRGAGASSGFVDALRIGLLLAGPELHDRGSVCPVDTIYLLSSSETVNYTGAGNRETATSDMLKKMNPYRKVKIHVIAFGFNTEEKYLRDIAANYGGNYVYIPSIAAGTK